MTDETFRRFGPPGSLPTDVDLGPVVAHLEGGGLLAHPTETVYGFGGLVEAAPLERLRELKGRGDDKPVLLLVPGPSSVERLEWTDAARDLARVFWPGSVTLVLADPAEIFPPGVRSRSGTVAVRRTAHPLTARLVERLGRALTSTSANEPGRTPARDVEGALRAAERLGAGDWMAGLDGGVLAPSAPSTIVDCTSSPARVLRAGAMPTDRLRCLLPDLVGAPDD